MTQVAKHLLKEHPWLAVRTTVAAYVGPEYYERLLRPYVFRGATDLDLLRGWTLRRPPTSLLELGSGTGRVTRVLLDEVKPKDFTLVDLSPQMLAFTRA